jgi:hypothetical protein
MLGLYLCFERLTLGVYYSYYYYYTYIHTYIIYYIIIYYYYIINYILYSSLPPLSLPNHSSFPSPLILCPFDVVLGWRCVRRLMSYVWKVIGISCLKCIGLCVLVFMFWGCSRFWSGVVEILESCSRFEDLK